jgi:hypothetical protein
MPEQFPLDESRRLPNVYTSPDETVAEVGGRPFAPREIIQRRSGEASKKFGAVVRTVIEQALWEHALNVADGDYTRLVPRPDGSVIVANTREQAQRAKRDPTFGTIGPSDVEEP